MWVVRDTTERLTNPTHIFKEFVPRGATHAACGHYDDNGKKTRDTLEGPEIPLVSRDLSGTEDVKVKVKQKNRQHVKGWAIVGWVHLPVLPLSRAY